MDMEQKERLYLIRWKGDGKEAVTSGFQVEAIRHSEGKWYKGQPQMDIIREATPADLEQYPPEDEQDMKMRDRCMERKWKELEDIPFDEADSPSGLVLAEDWWGFTKGTDREEIWHAFDANHSKGVAFLLYGEERRYTCNITNDRCIYTTEQVICRSCPIWEEKEKQEEKP